MSSTTMVPPRPSTLAHLGPSLREIWQKRHGLITIGLTPVLLTFFLALAHMFVLYEEGIIPDFDFSHSLVVYHHFKAQAMQGEFFHWPLGTGFMFELLQLYVLAAFMVSGYRYLINSETSSSIWAGLFSIRALAMMAWFFVATFIAVSLFFGLGIAGFFAEVAAGHLTGLWHDPVTFLVTIGIVVGFVYVVLILLRLSFVDLEVSIGSGVSSLGKSWAYTKGRSRQLFVMLFGWIVLALAVSISEHAVLFVFHLFDHILPGEWKVIPEFSARLVAIAFYFVGSAWAMSFRKSLWSTWKNN